MTHIFPERDHDHARCIAAALRDAAVICGNHGARLTPLRRRVLEIVWQSHQPLGAYAVLEVLSRDGRLAGPTTVYRALDFLLDHGLVHRIASLNAFVGCTRPGHRGGGEFLICQVCGDAAELTDAAIAKVIRSSAAAEGFVVERQTVEVAGLCPNCR